MPYPGNEQAWELNAASSLSSSDIFLVCQGTSPLAQATFTQLVTLLSSTFITSNAVSSVFGRTGAVTAQTGDYTVAKVTGAAPLASPTFSGTVTGPVFQTTGSSGAFTVARRDTSAASWVFYSSTGDFRLFNVSLLADALTIDPSNNNAFFVGAISASNLSGTNTGDQNLSPYALISSLGTAAGHAATDFVSSALTSAHVIVGNASNVAASVAITGNVTISNAGVTTIGAGQVTNAMLAGSITFANLVGTDITGVGTLTAGTWAATTIAVAHGGTGVTTLTGIPKASGTSAFVAATEGTDYLSGASAKLNDPISFGGSGTPTIANDVTPWLYVPFAATVVRVTLSCNVAPTGNFQVTIKRSNDSGSTFPTTIASVTVGSGSRLVTTTTITTPALAAGDYLRCDVISVNGAATWTMRLDTLSQNQ